MNTDVLIVGGGIAGCTAALLFARHGLHVTVVEKKSRIDEYKKFCTHFIQPSALPVIKRLNLDRIIESAGGLPNKADIWTKAGWIRSDNLYCQDQDLAHGYNIERRILDPTLRTVMCQNPLVRYMPGTSLISLQHDAQFPGKIDTAICKDLKGESFELKARLVVGADGRHSKTASLLDNNGEVSINSRFACFAYFRDVTLDSRGHSQFWQLDPDMAFAYPLHDNTTLLCFFIRKTEWVSWKNNLEEKFMAFAQSLPDGPQMEKAVRLSRLYYMLEMPNVSRKAVKDGVAFIGDAALSLDPMSGVGCGFAFQSAEWLADHTIESLINGGSMQEALDRYSSYHDRCLSPHAAGINADSLAEPDNGNKLRMFQDVVKDEELTESFLSLTGRIITPQKFQTLYLKKMIEKRKNQIVQEK